MSDYRVSETDLTAVADAIRTKGGTVEPLSFPYGFVSAVRDIPSGGGSTLITKNITANGTYNAEDDNADGYSAVNVNVQLTRYLSGTFTPVTEEKGSAKSISLPYFGNGYPVACIIYPTVGAYKSGSDIYTRIQKQAILWFSMAKSNIDVAPDYIDNIEKNQASSVGMYKNSDSDATIYATSGTRDARIYTTNSAAASSTNCVRFNSATSMSVFIAGTSYGFADGIEYTYNIIYSE